MDDPKFNDKDLEEQLHGKTPKDEKAIQGEVVENEEKLNGLFATVEKLKPYWQDFKDCFAMIKDYVTGNYREVPFRTIAALAGALIYVLSPLDLIADFIPIIGYADDVAVFALALKLAGPDLEKYRAWKNTQA